MKRMISLALLCAFTMALGGCAVTHGVAPSAFYQSYVDSKS